MFGSSETTRAKPRVVEVMNFLAGEGAPQGFAPPNRMGERRSCSGSTRTRLAAQASDLRNPIRLLGIDHPRLSRPL